MSAAIGGSTATITIPGGGSSQQGIVVYDDSVFVASGTQISFDNNLQVIRTKSPILESYGYGLSTLVLSDILAALGLKRCSNMSYS